MTESRTEAWKRISEMAGVDEDGSILPPPAGIQIDRGPVSWWRNKYAEPLIAPHPDPG